MKRLDKTGSSSLSPQLRHLSFPDFKFNLHHLLFLGLEPVALRPELYTDQFCFSREA